MLEPRFFLAPVFLVCASFGAVASDGNVDLRSPDGAVDMRGTFVAFDGGSYIIETPLGEFSVSADRVDCFGAACPFFDTNEPDIRIAVSDVFEENLILDVIEAYARTKGGEFHQFDLPRKAETFSSVLRENGEPIHFAVMRATRDDITRALRDGYAQITITSAPKSLDGFTATAFAKEVMVPVRRADSQVAEMAVAEVSQAPTEEPVGDIDEFAVQVAATATGPGDDKTEDLVSMLPMTQSEAALDLAPLSRMANGQAMRLLDSCGAAVKLDRFAVKTGLYPYAQPLFVSHRSQIETKHTADFLLFILSRAVAPVLAEHGLVDQFIEVLPMNAHISALQITPELGLEHDLVRLRELRDLRATHQRLSATFYFPTGTVDVDHIEPVKLRELAAYLQEIPAGANVVFAGFTDDVGQPKANHQLSLERANKLVEAVQAVGGNASINPIVNTLGFGEISPTMCNSDEFGRSLNRRVEIWITLPNTSNIQSAYLEKPEE